MSKDTNPERWLGKRLRLTSSMFASGYADGYISSIDHKDCVLWFRVEGTPKDAPAYGIRFWQDKQLVEI